MSDTDKIQIYEKNDTEEPKKNKYESQERWQRKAGYISKAYKLKQETVVKFAEACNKAHVTQAAQIKKMMDDFIEETLGKQD